MRYDRLVIKETSKKIYLPDEDIIRDVLLERSRQIKAGDQKTDESSAQSKQEKDADE